jgi:hypothetical protein
MKRIEAGHAAADQVRVARDVATMFNELKVLAGKHAALHANKRGFRRSWRERESAELARARRL